MRLPELPPARSCSAGCLRREQKQRKGTLEGNEILRLAPEVALLYLYFFFSSSSLFNAVILETEGSRKLAPAPLARSGAGRSSTGPLLQSLRTLPPTLPLPFVPTGPSQGAARQAKAVRAAPCAWHHRLALSWALSHRGPAVAALTKAEACVPLSSLCLDPRPGCCRCRGRGQERQICFGPGQRLNGFSRNR